MTYQLPRSSPSAQGVDPLGILRFLDAVETAELDFHSLMLVRHGHVVAEGWWAPYRPDCVHLLYSLSKSFTSTAVGIAESEGLLSLDDAVAGFFPDKVPPDMSPYVAAMRVRHLLSMSSGHSEDTWAAVLGRPDTDIVQAFLALAPQEEPGSLFCYNQGCTYMLSAIITRITGQRLVDYLRPRLFDPLGIDQAYWLQADEATDQGFSGLHVVTESIAKLGQLYLQDGKWEGKQLVPKSYVHQAQTRQVDNSHQSVNPDWRQGYGFQFWLCRHRAYRGDGAFGQFCVVVPGADAVFVCTAQVEDTQAQLELFWEHLLPALSGAAGADPTAEQRLAARLSRLSAPVIDAPPGRMVHDVTFTRTGDISNYTEQLEALSLSPVDGGTVLSLVAGGKAYSFTLRQGQWAQGELPAPGVPVPAVAVSGGWTSLEEFTAEIVWLTLPHRLRIRARLGEQATFETEWCTTPFHIAPGA